MRSRRRHDARTDTDVSAALAVASTDAGIPAATMDSFAFERDDRTVHVSLPIPSAELAGLATMAGALMQ